MKKKFKYLFLIIILIIIALSVFFVFQKKVFNRPSKSGDNNAVSNTIPGSVPTTTPPFVPTTTEAIAARKVAADYSIMTLEERKELKIMRGIRVEVLRRDDKGKITDYQVIK